MCILSQARPLATPTLPDCREVSCFALPPAFHCGDQSHHRPRGNKVTWPWTRVKTKFFPFTLLLLWLVTVRRSWLTRLPSAHLPWWGVSSCVLPIFVLHFSWWIFKNYWCVLDDHLCQNVITVLLPICSLSSRPFGRGVRRAEVFIRASASWPFLSCVESPVL